MNAFWDVKTLDELTPNEWEQLCDGCGKCCLHKLEDEQTGELYFTRVACQLFDATTCRCQDYIARKQRVPECVVLTPKDTDVYAWLPETCAYRLRAFGQPLASWHPLVSGRADSVHEAGVSVRGKTLPEQQVTPEELEEHIVYWV